MKAGSPELHLFSPLSERQGVSIDTLVVIRQESQGFLPGKTQEDLNDNRLEKGVSATSFDVVGQKRPQCETAQFMGSQCMSPKPPSNGFETAESLLTFKQASPLDQKASLSSNLSAK